MRKWLGLILIVIVAGGLLFVFKVTYQPKKVIQIESIIPEETVNYLYSYNLAGKINDFYNSPFCRKISELSLYKKFAESEIKKLETKIAVLSEIFKNDTALATFSSRVVLPKMENEQITVELSKFLFLTRIGPKANIKKMIGDFYLAFAVKEKAGYSKHRGITITNYALPEKIKGTIPVLGYALLGDVIVLSNSNELIKKSIDLFRGKSKNSLLNEETFQDITGNRKEAGKEVLLWGYTNYKSHYREFLSETAKGYFQEEDFSLEKGIQFGKLRDFIKNFMEISKGMFTFLAYDESREGFVWETYQFFDKSKDKQHFLDTFISPEGGSKNIFGMIPSDIIGYFAFSGNLTSNWKYLKNIMSVAGGIEEGKKEKIMFSAAQKIPDFSGILKIAESFLGVNIEKDILPLLGKTFGGVFADIEEISFDLLEDQSHSVKAFSYPVPALSFFIETKDSGAAQEFINIITHKVIPSVSNFFKEKMEKLGNEMTGQFSEKTDILKLSSESYEGTGINVLSVQDFPIALNCFVLDRYAVISSSLGFTEKVIRVHNGRHDSLANYFNSKFGDDRIFTSNSYILFFDFDRMVRKITRTGAFNFLKSNVSLFSKGEISAKDLDALIDVIDDISLFMQTYRLSEDGTGEILNYIKIEGL